MPTIKVEFDIPVGKTGDVLRPLPGAHGRNEAIQSHHQAMRRLVESQPRSGDH